MRCDMDERQECESCGGDYHLMSVDGLILCQHCRDEYYRKEYSSFYPHFILSDEIGRHNFLVNFFFNNLSDQEKDKIISDYIERGKELFPPFVAQLKALYKDYVDEYHEEFTDWMDNLPGVQEVRQ